MKPDNLLLKVKAAVKSCEELQGIVCKYKDSRSFAANPVCEYTLYIGMGKTAVANSSDGLDVIIEKEIKLCLLAPAGAGGKRLYEMACWVGEAVRAEFPLCAMDISEVKCNDTNNTLYSDIVLKIHSEKAEENAGFDVLVSGLKLEGVISVEVSGDDNFEKKAELLNGYSLSAKSTKEYRITLKMKEPLFRYGASFTLVIDYQNKRETYLECVAVNCVKTFLSSGDVCFGYELISYKLEEKYRGVDNE